MAACVNILISVYLILAILPVMTNSMSPVSPFFFLCNYHGNVQELGFSHGEVAISVSISGNPEYYVPGQFYEIKVSSSFNFDGFLLTGLYTLSDDMLASLARFGGNSGRGAGISAYNPIVGQNLMCSIIHTHIGRQPQHELIFMWLAPPQGTGCISLLATATLGHQLLFKDTIVFQLCEFGAPTQSPLRPPLATLHSHGIILRDDFDSSLGLFDETLWQKTSGGNLGSGCGTVMYGNAAVFCDTQQDRQLTSVPLNLTSASVLQFATTAGTCAGTDSTGDNDIRVQYGLDGCMTWHDIEKLSAPMSNKTVSHLIHLPTEAKNNGVCIRWFQKGPSVGCFAIDNILVVNTAERPNIMNDDFSPVNPGNWLFFPGAKVKHQCQSDSSAMYFTDDDQTHNFATTRDMNMQADEAHKAEDAILIEEFDKKSQDGWHITGGRVDMTCGQVHHGNSLVMDGAKKRIACTPYLDTRAVGSLQFYFAMGSDSCHAAKTDEDSSKTVVLVFIEDKKEHTDILQKLEAKAYESSQLVSIPLSSEQKMDSMRVCWIQKYHTGQKKDVWALDTVQLLPHLPVRAPSQTKDKVLQFRMNLDCGDNTTDNRVDLEFSPNNGQSWHLLHTPCLPGSCHGQHQAVSSSFPSANFDRWATITLPLPYAAQTPNVRFRWQQTTPHSSNWAIDNVYIGFCPEKCNGHGMCQQGDTCRCYFGYTGPTCKRSVRPNLSSLTEKFTYPGPLPGTRLLSLHGGTLSYDCGVLSSGKALVFNGDGLRQLSTAELNTTESRYLQFSLRIGSNSMTSLCPPPDNQSESLLLQYSCDGGIIWNLIKQFNPKDYHQPKMDSVMLPEDAMGESCKFRWWQPYHSGAGHDVWAIDDISLNSHLINMLSLDMNDVPDDDRTLAVNNGELRHNYCGYPRSLSFIGAKKDQGSRFVMTDSLHIGPSFMIQFDLTMGCGVPYVSGLDNKIYLEFSADHGISWTPVVEPCLPPHKCSEFQGGTMLYASQYQDWTTVTVLLPQETWSPNTRFRLRQPEWAPTDTWAISRLYVGQQCPGMCRGHGKCHHGFCKCDAGYVGESCEPEYPLADTMQADFTVGYKPQVDFLDLNGGDVTPGHQGCSTILSGESLYFSKNGVRELISKDLNTTYADYIQFYIRIGGTDSLACHGASERNESVLLQYSSNGGISWHLLQDMYGPDFTYPRLVHVELPKEARSPSTRFRWWQPSHSGVGQDQWAIDGIVVGRHQYLRRIEDNFNMFWDVNKVPHWLTITDGVTAKYCRNRDGALVLGNQDNDKFVITKDLQLSKGDVIQFRISVGCRKQFHWDHPVMLQYSADHGQNWNLVQEPCYPGQNCQGPPQEGSIYYSGTHGAWTLVNIPVTEKLTMRPILLRWWQPGGFIYNFALDDVHIGPVCEYSCHNHGRCKDGKCVCDKGYEEPYCTPPQQNPPGLVDRFDNIHMPGEAWQQVSGGYLGTGCGPLDFANSLYFSSDGTREAVTKPLDTTHLKMLQFVVKIGSLDFEQLPGCRRAEQREEGVVVDYSNDHGITWHPLRVVEPRYENATRQIVSVKLPPDAKTNATIFRWWQPLGLGDLPRAEWAIDSVIIGVNDTSATGFQDDFSSMMPRPDLWYMTQDGVPKITCKSNGNALEFSRIDAGIRYAETWDYHITPSTFLQFDLAMGCGDLYGTIYSVMLEYSVNMGKTWHPVVDECMPPNFECRGYHLSSDYVSERHKNWTRTTVYLPPGAISPATRFRWLQHTETPRANIWALDNVYLGEGCPWLCSGHGYCDNGTCVCDKGFFGMYCVPLDPLPMMLRDDFDHTLDHDRWPEVYGGDATDACGIVVSGTALAFYKESIRMAVSKDIDTSMLENIEFTFKYGCTDVEKSDWPRAYSVLLQYSNNGGILWKLLQELHYHNETGSRFFNIILPPSSKTNATRFRFWQPKHEGHKKSGWAVDNLFLGTMAMKPSILYDTFDTAFPLNTDYWLFPNTATIGEYCTYNNRSDTVHAGKSALVFKRGNGEHSVTTRDMHVGPMSVLQFDINVGCDSAASNKYPVRLEYSADGGKTWHLLVQSCMIYSIARCQDKISHPTLYYSGVTPDWRRISVPLDNVHTCGSVRFRWYQGQIPKTDFGPEWALDNVYIGMMCMDHCLGHGSCINGMFCECDEGYSGAICSASTPKPMYLKDDFDLVIVSGSPDGSDLSGRGSSFLAGGLEKDKWLLWSNGQISQSCGILITGNSVVFSKSGERVLSTIDLDLTKGSMIQFYLRLGCRSSPPDRSTPPVFLQYSTNGGIHWITIEQFDFNVKSHYTSYVVVHLPPDSKHNTTRIRWWQPSIHGTFQEDWAIDQIYIGGDTEGALTLQDEPLAPKDSNWLLYPGGVVEPVCGDNQPRAIHFKGASQMRYAISSDVTVDVLGFIQFELSMGCIASNTCYNIRLEFSLDMGKNWNFLEDACVPSNVDCSNFYPGSSFPSDQHHGWSRVTVPLPYYAKSTSTRFRWIQPDGFSYENTWAIRHLYLGNNCLGMCSGHGQCNHGRCLCDDNWSGYACNEPKIPLPTMVQLKFSDDLESEMYTAYGGEVTTNMCESLTSGPALHFIGGCSRMLVTKELNLTSTAFIQFYFLFGCNTAPRHRDEGVLVDVSIDGITWAPITELYYSLYTKPTFVSVKLSPEAQAPVARIRWWQPQHPGAILADWAIDSIVIGGTDVNPNQMQDFFTLATLDPTLWTSDSNVEMGTFCNLDAALLGKSNKVEAAQLVSRDVEIRPQSVIQFSITIGCSLLDQDGPDVNSGPPVKLHFSTDRGMTWSILRPQCLPHDPKCYHHADIPTIYYPSPGWQRVIIPLNGLHTSGSTRFRWYQPPSKQSLPWAISDVYIGPMCVNNCHGHGICNYPDCICDDEYKGVSCENRVVNTSPVVQLKDTFSTPGPANASRWSLVQGGSVTEPCATLVEGSALVFSGPEIRQLVTPALDLRDATFIQYYATVGGGGQKKYCFTPVSEDDNVILQYSDNAGIIWNTLHVLDYKSYQLPQRDYIQLPLDARTESTQIRWWQPLPSSAKQPRPCWAIDNVLIGGHEINPSFLSETFSGAIIQDDAPWEFSPNGNVVEEVCTKRNTALSFAEKKSIRSFTTNQLIVQHGYMMQFKIVVGCDHESQYTHINIGDDMIPDLSSATARCPPTPTPVTLEYNRNPAANHWKLLQVSCYPHGAVHNGCKPGMHHGASVYTSDEYQHWTRVTMELPAKVFSSSTQFRWMQSSSDENMPTWALDDIYVGEICKDMCNGRGDCITGRCHCDLGYVGPTCRAIASKLPSRLVDTFEGGLSKSNWDAVTGGQIGFGCGALLPYGHGKTLYFNGCGIRKAITVEMDLTKASTVMFVLQVGSVKQTSTCNVNLSDQASNRGILLQYTINKGIVWHPIAQHEPKEFVQPERVAYSLPSRAKVVGVQLRWWQPVHGGAGQDQWAIDQLEIIGNGLDRFIFPEERSSRKR